MTFMHKTFSSGNSSPGFSFWKPGDRLVGTIIDIKDGVTTLPDDKGHTYDATILMIDMDVAKSVSHTRELESVDLAEDGTERSVWLADNKPAMCRAVQEAVKASGATDITVGGTIAIVFAAYGEQSAEAKKKGWNRPKLYEAQYKSPARSVNVDSLI